VRRFIAFWADLDLLFCATIDAEKLFGYQKEIGQIQLQINL